jgi:2-hydroxy-3-keto-5-methylthiopentenyl-1-phosphate phosphatase
LNRLITVTPLSSNLSLFFNSLADIDPSGMMPTIRAVLSNLLPAEDANSIDIIANEVLYTDAEKKGDEWEIVYRHPESHYGHDKSKAILPYKDLEDPPTLFFCGDGVSG